MWQRNSITSRVWKLKSRMRFSSKIRKLDIEETVVNDINRIAEIEEARVNKIEMMRAVEQSPQKRWKFLPPPTPRDDICILK